jgi:hypothetical protein
MTFHNVCFDVMHCNVMCIVLYETIEDLDLPATVTKTPPKILLPPAVPVKVTSNGPTTPSPSVTPAIIPGEDHIYWAFSAYPKRVSGEVTLSAGSSVNVLHKDMTGDDRLQFLLFLVFFIK